MRTYTMDLTRQSEPISVSYLANSPFLISKPAINFKPTRGTNSTQARRYRSTKSHNNLNHQDSSRIQSVQVSEDDNNSIILTNKNNQNQKKNITGIFEGKVLILSRQKNQKNKKNPSTKSKTKNNVSSNEKSKDNLHEHNLKIFSQYYKNYNKTENDKVKQLQKFNLTSYPEGNSHLLNKRKPIHVTNKENQYQGDKMQGNQINVDIESKKKDDGGININGASINSTNPRLTIYRNNIRKNKVNSKMIDPIQLDQNVLPTQNDSEVFEPYFKQQERYEGRKSLDQYTSLNYQSQKEKNSYYNNEMQNTNEISSAYISRKQSQTGLLQNDGVLSQGPNQISHECSLSNSIPKKGTKISASRALQYFCQIFKRQNLDRMVIKKTHVNNSKQINAKKIILQQRKDNTLNQTNTRAILTHKKRNTISTARVARNSKKEKINADQNFEIAGWDVDF